jgi:hypothetical protein
MSEASAFVLSVVGAKVENPGHPGGYYRDHRNVVLANRSEQDPEQWVPEPTVITEEDWRLLEPVAAALEAARATNPDFSLLHCAVTYGNAYHRTGFMEG